MSEPGWTRDYRDWARAGLPADFWDDPEHDSGRVLGTAHLPDATVAQKVGIIVVGLTSPVDPRRGTVSLAVGLGDDSHCPATEEEREYVVRTLENAADQMRRAALAGH